MPARSTALYRRGWRIRHRGFGEYGEEALRRLAAVDPGHARAICEFVFGTVWSRSHLDLKTRELIVLGVATALDKPNEVELHARAALRRGATPYRVMFHIGAQVCDVSRLYVVFLEESTQARVVIPGTKIIETRTILFPSGEL
jgi:hypothetical protein